MCPKEIDLVVEKVQHLPLVELGVGALDPHEAQNGIGDGDNRDSEGSREPGVEVAVGKRLVALRGESVGGVSRDMESWECSWYCDILWVSVET